MSDVTTMLNVEIEKLFFLLGPTLGLDVISLNETFKNIDYIDPDTMHLFVLELINDRIVELREKIHHGASKNN